MRDVSDTINYYVNEAFMAKRAAEAKREYVGASAIGDECLRKLQFSLLQVPPDHEPIGNMLRIWEAGHRWEDILADWLRMAGFELEALNPETGKQSGFSVLGGRGKGHFDGIIRGGPSCFKYPCLWECKALNVNSWQDVKKKGLQVSKPIYAAQVAIGQAYLELHENPAIFTALNKNTEELYHELVPFDQPLAQRMSDKMAQVIEATAHKEILPRAYAASDHFQCRQFCSYSEKCWSMKR